MPRSRPIRAGDVDTSGDAALEGGARGRAYGAEPAPYSGQPYVTTSCGREAVWLAVRERKSTWSVLVVASTKLNVPLRETNEVTSYSNHVTFAIAPGRNAPVPGVG